MTEAKLSTEERTIESFDPQDIEKNKTMAGLRPGLIRKYFRNDGVTSVIWGYTFSFMRIFPLAVCGF